MRRFSNNGKASWGSSRPGSFMNGVPRRQQPMDRRNFGNSHRSQLDDGELEILQSEEMHNDELVGRKLDRVLDRLDRFDVWRDETDRRFEYLEPVISRKTEPPAAFDDGDDWGDDGVRRQRYGERGYLSRNLGGGFREKFDQWRDETDRRFDSLDPFLSRETEPPLGFDDGDDGEFEVVRRRKPCDGGYRAKHPHGGFRDTAFEDWGRRGVRGGSGSEWDFHGNRYVRDQFGEFPQQLDKPTSCWDPPQRYQAPAPGFDKSPGCAVDQARPLRVRVSQAEKAERARLGLCYYCPDKWVVSHVCKQKMLSYVGEDVVSDFNEKRRTYSLEQAALLARLNCIFEENIADEILVEDVPNNAANNGGANLDVPNDEAMEEIVKTDNMTRQVLVGAYDEMIGVKDELGDFEDSILETVRLPSEKYGSRECINTSPDDQPILYGEDTYLTCSSETSKEKKKEELLDNHEGNDSTEEGKKVIDSSNVVRLPSENDVRNSWGENEGAILRKLSKDSLAVGEMKFTLGSVYYDKSGDLIDPSQWEFEIKNEVRNGSAFARIQRPCTFTFDPGGDKSQKLLLSTVRCFVVPTLRTRWILTGGELIRSYISLVTILYLIS